jgi:hypothetical protein
MNIDTPKKYRQGHDFKKSAGLGQNGLSIIQA